METGNLVTMSTNILMVSPKYSVLSDTGRQLKTTTIESCISIIYHHIIYLSFMQNRQKKENVSKKTECDGKGRDNQTVAIFSCCIEHSLEEKCHYLNSMDL